MSLTFAEVLTRENHRVHRELEQVARQISREYVRDVVEAVERGKRYRFPIDKSDRFKKTIKKLRFLARQKKKLDF